MSKSVLLRGLLLRAWRERWNDCQWGLNIKKILPRGVSGDAYNLAECILQQAVIGSGANQLMLSYLRHSLCSHLISYASVLKWISNYESADRHSSRSCLLTLLDFVDSIIPAVTCSNRQEESLMVDAINSLVRWLWRTYSANAEQADVTEKLGNVMGKLCSNDFLLGILCLAKVDNRDPMSEVSAGMANHRPSATPAKTAVHLKIERGFEKLLALEISQLEMSKIERRSSPTINHILQPLLVVELLKNASNDSRITSQLLLVQKLKQFNRPQFYCEILHSCLLTLQDVTGTPREALWCAFTFIKMPQIFSKLIGMTRGGGEESMETDTNADLLRAIDLLLEETSPLLDMLDFKCNLNTMECLMKEFQKHGLVTDKHTEHYAAKREGISANVQKLVPASQAASIVTRVIRVEPPLSGILKTLNTDYNKVQEPLSCLLFQVLQGNKRHGNSLELILSVATVEGKLKMFVNRLIKCNECSKQVPGEVGKPEATRAALFDVTFLYLTYIVQTYGTESLLEGNGDSFFETWVRQAMIDRRKLKSPMTIVRSCEQAKVDELLMYLNGAAPTTNLKWHEVCETIPGMLYQVLLAWENGLSSAEVKVILDNLKSKMGAYSVCAVSWLCSYLYAINEADHANPMNMVRQLLAKGEEISPPEKLELTNQIIRQMQADFQPRQAPKEKTPGSSGSLGVSIVSQKPLEEVFSAAWEDISDNKWLSVDAAQTLESLYESSGAFWLIQRLITEIDGCRYVTEVNHITDIVFSIMHLDIEAMTVALVSEVLPVLVSTELSHPYSTAYARLCVYSILSAIDPMFQEGGGWYGASKKRGRGDLEDGAGEPVTKIRKMDNTEFPEDMDFSAPAGLEGGVGRGVGQLSGKGGVKVREPLNSALAEMFKRFAQYVTCDEFSPRVNFVFEFITILVECGRAEALPVLKLIPSGFMQNLLKVMPLRNIKPGLILQMYDLSLASGRQAALSDLCVLRRNVQINFESIKI